MNVENWPIEMVKPYPNNPRKNDEAVEKVAASIREFSFQQPIVVDQGGVIIAGHTRYKAAQMLGLQEVPVTVAEGLTDNPSSIRASASGAPSWLSATGNFFCKICCQKYNSMV